ncbi:hypothetical protein L4174_014675 [Photobacterium sp. CCB-ST2H9]|uniref:hypothetical protein n=1 Tax=Photobacterium sp. CCB-ST2H9 TaxID=2912855 RepID=UPI0020C7280F|nr:hypothetical protein [Photobacterium sp. CCB-ST2H9]UTM57025.1 hypothetical protein L4174_014675 [Photobacterium sp. CCB-ST2H9]
MYQTQKIIEVQLQAGEKIISAVSQYLLIRDCSHTVTLLAKTQNREVGTELKKNDVVPLGGFETIELYNHHQAAVTLKYQLTDIPVNTQSDAVAISGAVEVHSIREPVTIDAIQQTVPVSFSAPVSVGNWPAVQPVSGKVIVGNLPDVQAVQGEVAITNLPAVQTVSGQVEIGNLPQVQQVSGLVAVASSDRLVSAATTLDPTVSTVLIEADNTRQSVLVQTDRGLYVGGEGVDNLSGIYIAAGESMTLETGAAVFAYAVEGATVRTLAEVRHG